MKTFLTLLLAIVPIVSFAQPIFRNPTTTNRFMNLPSNLSVPFWNAAAGRWSNATVSAGGDAGGTNSRQGGTLVGTNLVNNPNVVTNILGAGTVTVTSNNAGTFTITGSGGSAQVWTNENDYVRLVDGSTNSLKVMTNGLFGIAIGDTNAMNFEGWPSSGKTYMSVLDGSSGHGANTWFHGVSMPPSGDVFASARIFSGSSPANSLIQLESENAASDIDASASIHAGEDVTLRLTDSFDGDLVWIQVGGDVLNNGSMIWASWHGQERFLLSTNGSLTLGATTNHITFGATNSPPASAAAPTRWVSVLINGEATQYKIPLYQ